MPQEIRCFFGNVIRVQEINGSCFERARFVLSRHCSYLQAVKGSLSTSIVQCATQIKCTTQSPVHIQFSLYMSVLQDMFCWIHFIQPEYATQRRLVFSVRLS